MKEGSKNGDRRLTAMWPLVRARLPPAPARVVDVGCGRRGGFVPFLRSSGYQAVGVDPEAPEGAHYHRVEFERLQLPKRFDAAIASTSLHHVSDPREVIDRLAGTVTSGGTLVVLEWAWERFDEATANWCFERLASDGDATWLHRHRNEWVTSSLEWPLYLSDWAARHRVHPAETLRRLLDERFERRSLAHAPYFFPDLVNTSERDEQAAIEAGQIQATRVDWCGTVS